jgi:tight adherence protein B
VIWRLGVFVSAALVAAASIAAGGAAAPRLQLSPEKDVVWPDRGYLLSLGSSQRLEASRVSVTENGKAVLGAKVQPASSAAQVSFGTVLVIDASDSMRGEPIKGAVEAARAFAARRNVNQRLAVLTFNSADNLLLPFTRRDERIRSALANVPRLAQGTRLYDAAAQATAQIQAAGVSGGAVVLLTDGADTGSDVTLAELTRIAQDAHVRLFTVGLRSSTFRPGPLQQLAGETGGSYSEAGSSAALARIFDQLGLRLANEYLVTYRSLANPNQRVRVSVSVEGRGSARAGYKAPPFATPTFDRPLGDRVWQSWVTMLVFALLFAALIGLALFAALRPPQSTVRRRLSDFVSTAKTQQESREALASRIFEETERSLEETRWWRGFKEALELANVRIKPVQLLLGTLVLTLFAMWLLGTIVAAPAALLGLAVPFAVRSVIMRRVEKKRRAFGDQLPDNLDVVASGLRAGHSIVGALALVVNDAPEPSRSEFQRVVADEQLGVPLEDALGVVAQRMKSRDVEQVALVASLQRETGGNSAEVLDRVTESIRERSALRRLVRTLTAQGRMSRWVVSFLPVGLLLIISVLNPAYMKPLFTHASGRIMLAFAATMIVAGSLVIKKIVDIKV